MLSTLPSHLYFLYFSLLFLWPRAGRLLVPCLSRVPAPETGTREGLCGQRRYAPRKRRKGSGELPAVLMAPDCLCTGRMGAGTGRAEELSKELSRRSLIHAWCTTRWQNTATAYGGGGRGGGGQWMEGIRGEVFFFLLYLFSFFLRREPFARFWGVLIKQTKHFSHPKCLPLHCSSSC